jgi:hypothetical protein
VSAARARRHRRNTHRTGKKRPWDGVEVKGENAMMVPLMHNILYLFQNRVSRLRAALRWDVKVDVGERCSCVLDVVSNIEPN